MSLSAARRQTAVGIMMILMGVFALSLSDALVKFLSPSIPLCEILLLRSLHVIPALVAMLILRAESGVLRPRSLFWVSLRSVLLAAMWIIYYVALSALPLPVAGVGIYTAPLFIALLSTTMTDEPVGKRRWFALVTGFGGIVLALRPNPGAFSPIILLPIVAAFAYALAMSSRDINAARNAPSCWRSD